MPGSIIESMYMELAVVTYDVGNIRRLNRERESIALVQKGDIAGFSEKLTQLLNDKELLEQYVVNAAEPVQQFFDKKRILLDISEIYNKIVFGAGKTQFDLNYR